MMAEKSDEIFQGVGVVSCSHIHPNTLLEKIFGQQYDEGKFTSHDFGSTKLKCYPWHLDTKYYATDISFVVIPSHDTVLWLESDSMFQALIIHLDNNNASGIDLLNLWKPFIERFNPSIRMLIVETAGENFPLSRHTLITWCIAHGFELIELEPGCNDDDEMDDDFKESNGVDRIFQALSAHIWPKMDMKEASGYRPSNEFKHLQKQAEASAAKMFSNLNDPEEMEKSMQKLRIDSLFDEDKDIFDCLMHSEEPNFEELFDKFQDLKKKAEKLTGEERKLYAEKVTLSFWKALSGSEDEIEGLEF